MSETGRKVVYYVTGHGYGHAQRAAQVMRRLVALRDDVTVLVRTSAPQWIFQTLGPRVRYEPVVIDRGAIEEDPLRIDWEATLANLAQFVRGQEALVEGEAAVIRNEGASLIVADVPFVAGYVAEAAGVPCVAVGNFTWDWVYEPYLRGQGRYPGLWEHVRGGYARMKALLKLPFGHEVDLFEQVVDVPLIARPTPRTADQVLREIRVDRGDSRRRVLVGMRGGVSTEALEAAARSGPEFLFLYPEPSGGALPANVMPVRLTHSLSFWDVMSVCEAVVSKLGHGIVTDCAASQVSLLWPARTGFREDPLVAQASAPYFRSREIPLDDFHRGVWGEHLRRLLAMPKPRRFEATNGAEVCVGVIGQWIG